ncbi:MAG TPA: hypothetical protein VKR82_02090 [Candidatus Acidoferrales bacterium]|nr:hypothetical protein [Candidatus Acidoferrales bacterium]
MSAQESSPTSILSLIQRNRLAAAGLAVIAATLLLPIWIVRFPPLLDYPNHLASSFVLARLQNSSYDFGQYYSASWGLKPYIATDFLMGALGRVMPQLIAGKIVVSLGVLGLPLAACFFLRQANPGENAPALWVLLGVHNLFFLYGFVGFYCSLAMMFLALGLWLRWLKTPSFNLWILTFLALMATYFTHLIGFLFAGLVIGLYSITRLNLRKWLRSAALLAAGVIFYFISSRAAEHQTSGADFRTLHDKLQAFLLILHGYSSRLDQVSIAAIVFFFFFAWLWNREFKWQWRWLVVTCGLVITFAVLPNGFGEGYDIDIRVLPVLFVVLFATARIGRRGWWLAPLALLLFAGRTFDVTNHFRAAQPEMAGMAEAFALTPPNVRVLPIVAGHDEDPILQYYAHFWAYGVIERGWFSPYLLESPGLLPLHIKTDSYTLDGFWDLDYNEKVDWAQVRKDYDYVWAYDAPDYDAGLRGVGKLVYFSGKLKLFRSLK